jgi:hypothetical protein
MFKVGDRVICINEHNKSFLKENKVYMIDKIMSKMIIIDHIVYNSDRFITLQEDRRRKLNKIISKMNG